VLTNRQTEQDEIKTYMRAITPQQDDNLLQATGCGANSGPRTQDRLPSLLTLETESLTHQGQIEAAAVGILGDPDLEEGLIMIRTTTNIKLDGKRIYHMRGSMGQEWVIDHAAEGDIISTITSFVWQYIISVAYCNSRIAFIRCAGLINSYMI
jgi:hypothetical protein